MQGSTLFYYFCFAFTLSWPSNVDLYIKQNCLWFHLPVPKFHDFSLVFYYMCLVKINTSLLIMYYVFCRVGAALHNLGQFYLVDKKFILIMFIGARRCCSNAPIWNYITKSDSLNTHGRCSITWVLWSELHKPAHRSIP